MGFCLTAALGAGQAMAQPAAVETPDVLSRVYACRDVAEDAARLACFDAATGALRAADEAGEFAGMDRSQVETVERESFGFRIPSLSALVPRFGGGDREVPNVELTVDRVVQRANGYHAFVMTNGQVWVQVEPESARNVRSGTAVTVRRASMGSFMMSSERGGSAHRVRREE